MNTPLRTNGQTPTSILLLGTQIATGGAQKVLLDQAHWFHARGYKVTAAFFYDRDGLFKKWRDASPFPVVNLSSFHKTKGILRNSVSIIRGLWRLWKLLRREKFDAIETFTHDSNTLALPLAWMARVPVRIATHHGIIAGIPRWREKIHAWMVNHDIATRIVAVSAMTRQKLLGEGIQPGRIVVIQNGINPVSLTDVDRLAVRSELGMGAEDPFLLAVGRLVFSKAHRVLVAAMPAVLKKFPTAKAGICGDGVMRPELEAQIRSLGLSNSVKLLGQADNVTKFLASADVFVMPSLWEGLPIALLEAMSAGLPAIATRVEGVEEVIVEGEHGLLVPIENTEALANAILRLLADPQLCQRMGAAARKKVLESYTADHMCEQYLALMSNL